jgi:DNA polymerase-3 subunit delta'
LQTIYKQLIQMNNTLYPWQDNSWRSLARLREYLPHAILFYGAEGTGKTVFVERFAQSLLCESRTADGQPCDQCISCGWFSQYSHPDYRRIRPEVFEDGAETAEDESTETADVKKSSAKSAKAPSKEIKIDQIRALTDFMNISTHRRGKRVILLYPAEALNTAAANSLLKTLEEPAPDTVILLVSNGIDRLLPTILSRCRKFPLTVPSREEALSWLEAQGVDDADVWLSEQGGAPLIAHAQAQSGSRETMDEFLAQLAKPTTEGMLKTAERLQKIPLPELVAWMQRWLYDLFSVKLSGRIRYYPRYRKELAALAGRAQTDALLKALKSANDRRAIAQHPLSAKLFIEEMLLDYSIIFY